MLLLLYPENDFEVNISLTQDMLCCLRSIVEIVCICSIWIFSWCGWRVSIVKASFCSLYDKYVFNHKSCLQMDYINTSHPGFLGGSKAVEAALQQQWGSKVSTSNITKAKVSAQYLCTSLSFWCLLFYVVLLVTLRTLQAMDFKVTFFTTFSHCRGPSAFKPILISCHSSRTWDVLLFNVNDIEFTDYSYICAPQRVNILAWHDQSCCVDRMRMTGRILELIGWQFQRSIPRDGQFWLGPVHLQLLFLSMYIQWFTSSVVCVLETGFVKFISVPILNMPLMPFEGGEMICVLKYSV